MKVHRKEDFEMPTFHMSSHSTSPPPPSCPPVLHSSPPPLECSNQHASSPYPIRRSPRLGLGSVAMIPGNKELKRIEPNLSVFYKSPFFLRNVSILKDLTQAEKNMADWVFGDLERSEVIFQDNYYSITREDLRCLSSEEGISEKIIDLWGHLLNIGEKRRDSSSFARYFVPTPHMMCFAFLSSAVILQDQHLRSLKLQAYLLRCLKKLNLWLKVCPSTLLVKSEEQVQ